MFKKKTFLKSHDDFTKTYHLLSSEETIQHFCSSQVIPNSQIGELRELRSHALTHPLNSMAKQHCNYPAAAISVATYKYQEWLQFNL